jgi:hypothetical protein
MLVTLCKYHKCFVINKMIKIIILINSIKIKHTIYINQKVFNQRMNIFLQNNNYL